jgi:hypothetical protein
VNQLVFTRRRSSRSAVDEVSSTRIWDWPSGVEALKLDGVGLAFSPDGKLLAGVQAGPTPFVHVWTLDPQRLLESHAIASRGP